MKKGKKNRQLLKKECGNLSVASPVKLVENKKSYLRNAKRVFYQKQKQDKAKSLNSLMQADPERSMQVLRK